MARRASSSLHPGIIIGIVAAIAVAVFAGKSLFGNNSSSLGDGEELIGVEIPPSFDKLNIEREQKYAFRVKVRQGGVPVATAINRL